MSLPARQRRVLEHIETSLQDSDPKLVALYALFGRLTRDEEIPGVEESRHRLLRIAIRVRLALADLWARPARRIGRLTGRLHIRLIPRQPAVLFFPLALAIVVASVVFAVRSGPGSNCLPRQVAASKSLAQHRLCRAPAMVTPPIYAR